MPVPRKAYAANDNSLSPWSFCRAILVDVGEICNSVDLICRPRNAKCTSRSGEPRICLCESGYFPVYQQSLHYHECFFFSNGEAGEMCTVVYDCGANSSREHYDNGVSIEIKQVPCKRPRNRVGHNSDICVDLNGDEIPDDNFCSRNGSSFNLSPIQPGMHEPSEPMSISYSHDWPALDIILEKGNELSGLVDLDSRNGDSTGENCGSPLGKCIYNQLPYICIYFIQFNGLMINIIKPVI
ncbi:unnamed protein product [Rodentolepis nana]|uniref:EB domain-containing protein n=1 Tax=Rodentolepis nana TaxID=102285 RepID=A0A0R3TGR6_RODNA|nr:unnamed protein product [Rodentolepis nana]